MVVEPGLCGICSETPKTGFLTSRLNSQCLVSINEHEFQNKEALIELFVHVNRAMHLQGTATGDDNYFKCLDIMT